MSVESIIGIISGLISIGGLFLALYNRYKQQSLADLLVKLTDSSLSTKEHQKILKKMNRKLVGAHIKSEYIQGFALKNRGKEAIFGSPAIFRVPLPKDPAQPEHEERQIGHPSQLSPEAFHLGVE